MRYYAHFGHRDFILCLGYRGDAIKEYFLRYEEALSNDFVLSDGGRQIELLGSDIQDWRITFADTGLDTTIGERLSRVRHHLEGEELFLANYGDTLTDAPLDRMVGGGALERGRGDAAERPPALLVPRRAFVTGRPRGLRPGYRVGRDPDQRRRLRAAPGNLRLPGLAARTSWTSRSAGSATEGQRPRDRVRRLLGVARHAQGPPGAPASWRRSASPPWAVWRIGTTVRSARSLIS